MDGDFLQRWSRLKRGADAAPAEPPAVSAEAEADTLTEDEIAALPDIGRLTAESDVTCFLRKGVPPVLRNAALRRIWMLDPAIRDFVGPARDYAYDWNCPGGVPGSGPLEPGAVTAAMLRRIFGDDDKPGPAAEPQTASVAAVAEDETPDAGSARRE